MALSDYLTDSEWDACLYGWFGQHGGCGLGESMRKTIDKLLCVGYRFSGLTETGQKFQQIPSSNPQKLMLFLGLRRDNPPSPEEIMALLDRGRTFLKVHCPSLVDETDEEWNASMKSCGG